MGKKVLLGCAIALGALAVLVVVGGIMFVRVIMPKMMSPAGMRTPSVTTGAGLFSKTTFLRDPKLGQVTDITYGPLGNGGSLVVGIAGQEGACLASLGGGIQSSVSFGGTMANVEIVQQGDSCYYLDRGSWSSKAALLDRSGKSIWTYGSASGVDDAVAGDVNGDGKLEFAVGFNGGGGIHLIDSRGQKMWSQSDGNVWHVEMADVNGDGKPEIIHSNAGGQLTVRSASGSIVTRAKPAPYFSHFSLCAWPNETGKTRALQVDKDKIWVIGLDGRDVAQLRAPMCGLLGSAESTYARLAAGKPDYFAVLATFSQWHASVLYVYDSDSNLVYQESLAGTYAAISSVPAKASSAETILIGGNGTVLQYSLAADSPVRRGR